MPVRVAGPDDAAAVARLRAAWTEGGPADAAFEAEVARWWADEGDRRTVWLAELDGAAVGMVTVAEFRRMPKPGQPAARWGYVANVFVLEGHRDAGIGQELLDTVLAEARARAYVRLVLAPSERSVPLYRRAGFRDADGLLVHPLD